MLSDPEIVLAEINRTWEAFRKQMGDNNHEKETACVRCQFKDYDGQEKRLINALRIGKFTQDFVSDGINRLKQEREYSGKPLDELQ